MSKGKLTTLQEAQSSIEKFKARTLQEGEIYVESFFFDIEAIKELIEGVPVKSITGVRIHLAEVARDGGFALSPVVEVVSKDNTMKGSAKKAAAPTSVCPDDCLTDN